MLSKVLGIGWHLWMLIAALVVSFILVFGVAQGAPAQEATDQEDGQQEVYDN